MSEQSQRGFTHLYHVDPHSVLHCPSCGHTQWHIGRSVAECAFCETALPIANIAQQPMEPRFTVRFSSTAEAKQGVH